MERLKAITQRRLPLLVGLGLVVLALVFVAPQALAWLPWNTVATQPAPPPSAGPGLLDPAVGAIPPAPPAAGARLPDPVGGAMPPAPPAPPAVGVRLPDPAVGAIPPVPPAPPVAGPRPAQTEPAGPPPPPQRPGAWSGWLLGWLLGGPRQWLSIALIVGGLWLLGRRQMQYAPPAVLATEPVHPETYQPVQEA